MLFFGCNVALHTFGREEIPSPRNAFDELSVATRHMQGKETLKKDLQVDDSAVVIADVVKDDITEAMKGCSALIVATSAKPEIIWTSLPGFFWRRFVSKEQGIMPGFTFAQSPEQVCHNLDFNFQLSAASSRACGSHTLPCIKQDRFIWKYAGRIASPN
jgi:hypothetical protein